MHTVERDPDYAPIGYLIVEEGYGTRDEEHTALVQYDWDFPSLASSLGYEPCECGGSDGTVDCCDKTASEMIEDAADWLDAHLGEPFDGSDYF